MPVTSLRRRLILALWVALVVVGMISVAATYVIAKSQANALLDDQMQQIAKAVASQTFDRPVPAAVLPHMELQADDDDDFIVVVDGLDGRRLYTTREDWPQPAEPWLGFRTVQMGGQWLRVYSARSSKLHITVAQQVETRQETATNAALSALFPVVLLLPVMGLVIGLVIRRELQPLRALARDVASREPLSLTPLTVAGIPVEVRPLVDEINELLKRLHVALEADQRFITDAAHALRTPLTALQLQADVLDGSSDRTEQAARLAELRAGIRRASKLADQLLTLARHGADLPEFEVLSPLDTVLGEIVELYRPGAASARGVSVKADLQGRCLVPGTARNLALLFGNLVDNAVRHAQQCGGLITVTSRAEGNKVYVEIADDGPGLPTQELARVFDRFYRVAGDSTEGNGLGLATVRAVVENLGGEVTLMNRPDRSGLVARVCLPIKAPIAEDLDDGDRGPEA